MSNRHRNPDKEPKDLLGYTNGCGKYVDIMTGENCSLIRLLFPVSFIGQFVYPGGGKGMGGSLF